MRSFEDILAAMLAKVPDDLDKREGSIIFTALAPVAAMVAEQQFYSDQVQDSCMPDTATGESLTRACAQFGVNRRIASAAVRKGIFTPNNVAIGSRFGADGISYLAEAPLGDGGWRLCCETTGSIGNRYFGAILPLDNLNPNLTAATLSDVLVPGEDAEGDEVLRTRFYAAMSRQPFGGNVAQYEDQITGIPGVGAVKVFPTPGGQGGMVQCVIVTPDNGPASAALVTQVQQIIDPDSAGQGYGMAPIGHRVIVSTVIEESVTVSTSIALAADYTLETIQPLIEDAIRAYFDAMAFVDSIVRVSRVEAEILKISGVMDITDTKLNGNTGNITLPTAYNDYRIPKLGAVTLTEGV